MTVAAHTKPALVYPGSASAVPAAGQAAAAKLVLLGGYGTGKTTLVRSASDIDAVTTEVEASPGGQADNDVHSVPGKASMTVALDFGRVTVPGGPVVSLFGSPGCHRFWFIRDELLHGALGVIVLVDPARLEDAFTLIDLVESVGVPFVVAVNRFDDSPSSSPGLVALRDALTLPASVPILDCDARDHDQACDALMCLVQHALTDRSADTCASAAAPSAGGLPVPAGQATPATAVSPHLPLGSGT